MTKVAEINVLLPKPDQSRLLNDFGQNPAGQNPHFIYGYMVSDIWLRTILIVRKETCCCHIGYSFRLTARVLLYAPSHRQHSKYHSLCYTRNSSMGRSDDPSYHERTLLPRSYISLLVKKKWLEHERVQLPCTPRDGLGYTTASQEI